MNKGHDDGHGHGHEEGHSPEDKGGPVEDTEPGDLVPNLHKKDSGEKGAEDEDSSRDEGEARPEEISDDSNSQNGEEKQDETPETSDDEEPQNTAHETDSGENVEGVQFKGSTSGGSREKEQGDTRKHIPDAKGGNKKRIESDYGKRLGVAADDNSGTETEKVRSPDLFQYEKILNSFEGCLSEESRRYDYFPVRQARRTVKYGYQTLDGHRQ